MKSSKFRGRVTPIFLGLVLSSLVVVDLAAQDSRPTTKPKSPPIPEGKAAAKAEAMLKDPKLATLKAPDKFRVLFSTTKGDFEVDVYRDWAPRGADRFYNLVKCGFYKDIAFFRVIDGFMAQFGIHGDPGIAAKWKAANINDDKVARSNLRGHISFAMAGPNTRTTQLFINYGDNSRLDGMGFPPFAVVVGDGMKVVDSLYKGYGEGAPRGRGPHQGQIQSRGNPYLKEDFPKLDYLKNVTLVTK